MTSHLDAISRAWVVPLLAADNERVHAGMVLRDARPIAKCHPDRALASKGLCGPCYDAQLPVVIVQPDPEARRTRPPTSPADEIEVFLATIEHSTREAAAHALGIGPRDIGHYLEQLYARIGAKSRPHAAWLLYRALGDRYVLPGDRARRAIA